MIPADFYIPGRDLGTCASKTDTRTAALDEVVDDFERARPCPSGNTLSIGVHLVNVGDGRIDDCQIASVQGDRSLRAVPGVPVDPTPVEDYVVGIGGQSNERTCLRAGGLGNF